MQANAHVTAPAPMHAGGQPETRKHMQSVAHQFGWRACACSKVLGARSTGPRSPVHASSAPAMLISNTLTLAFPSCRPSLQPTATRPSGSAAMLHQDGAYSAFCVRGSAATNRRCSSVCSWRSSTCPHSAPIKAAQMASTWVQGGLKCTSLRQCCSSRCSLSPDPCAHTGTLTCEYCPHKFWLLLMLPKRSVASWAK